MIKKIFTLIFDPLTVIKHHWADFIIWFIFTIIAGQLGIILNIIIRKYSYDTPVSHSIYLDSITGNFYTFVIATVASMLGPLFINIVDSKRLKFKTLKVFATVVTIFTLFFTGVIYSVAQSKNNSSLENIKIKIDPTQLTIYILSIFICIYAYSLIKLDNHQKKYGHLDDPPFSVVDDKKVALVTECSKSLVDDGKGNKL